ncbi:MAG: pantoate--beta-alanine ligase [Candidatus Omnitrophota bacterium]|jgi:pantoate--beta-alanine ligase
MKIIKNPLILSKCSKNLKLKGKSIGFVPTMGALHEGHLSLIRKAREENDVVVVSIFVNPAQFGPKEDLRKYPRPLKADLSLCKSAGVDYVFSPGVNDMFGESFSTYIDVKTLSGVFCGKSRPGHFRGVATIVAKLFNIIRPDTAYFGQKDAQQAIIIKRMAGDLNFPVKIKVMPIVRQEDGLALSSRNVYLKSRERKSALVLHKSLKLAELLIGNGAVNVSVIIDRMRRLILKDKAARIDYIAIVDPKNLEPLKKISGRCLIILAVWIGKTRLIDNGMADA